MTYITTNLPQSIPSYTTRHSDWYKTEPFRTLADNAGLIAVQAFYVKQEAKCKAIDSTFPLDSWINPFTWLQGWLIDRERQHYNEQAVNTYDEAALKACKESEQFMAIVAQTKQALTDALTQAKTDLTNITNQIKTDIANNIKPLLTKAQNDLNSFKTQIASAQTNINSINQQAQNAVNQANSAISKAQAALSNAATALTNSQTVQTNLANTKAALENAQTDLQKTLDTAKTNINNLTTQVNTAKTNIQSTVNGLNQQATKLTDFGKRLSEVEKKAGITVTDPTSNPFLDFLKKL
jgi:paraquat-inducible protein B